MHVFVNLLYAKQSACEREVLPDRGVVAKLLVMMGWQNLLGYGTKMGRG